MEEKIDHVTEASIKKVVDRFYGKIRKHSDLGPIFENSIGTSDENWRSHLSNMYDFWSSIMLASGRYSGTPMQKHIALESFNLELFDEWLALFEETTTEIHTADVVEQYRKRSHRIAKSLRFAIENKRGGVV